MVDGKIYEIRKIVAEIADNIKVLKKYPNKELVRQALELINRYCPQKHNPNGIKEGRIEGDMKRAREILEKIKGLGLEDYGYQ
ncbi:MAG: hypothetical protein QXY24_02255 [Candidatus Aenigmatarchaeota archaeon]